MNANELADWIDERNISSSSQTLGKAATMLRQQQDTIQKLSERIKWLEGASKLIRGQTND